METFDGLSINGIRRFTDLNPNPEIGHSEVRFDDGYEIDVIEEPSQPGESRRFLVQISHPRRLGFTARYAISEGGRQIKSLGEL